jgi:predicted nucleic acid-binding protein
MTEQDTMEEIAEELVFIRGNYGRAAYDSALAALVERYGAKFVTAALRLAIEKWTPLIK